MLVLDATPWAVVVALLAAAVAVAAAGGSCLAAALASRVARRRRSAAATAPNGKALDRGDINGHHGLDGPADGAAWLRVFGIRAKQQKQQQQQQGGAAALLREAKGGPFLVSHPVALDGSEDDGDGVDVPCHACGAGTTPRAQQQQQQQQQDGAGAPPAPTPAPPARASLARRARGRASAAAAAVAKAVDDALALVASLPRTLRTLGWAVRAGVSYKRFLMSTDPLIDPDGFSRGLSELHDYWAQRLMEVCRYNGGVYVKTGQFAAAFSSVPNEYRKHLALLQDKAKMRPFATVNRVIRRELGASAEEVFAEFSAEATAAASLAQVHKARLADGREVAVKIQYPGLRGAADADLTTLSLLSNLARMAFPEFGFGWLYTELRHKLEEELDFSVEVVHSTRLKALLQGQHGVVVPRIHLPLCTSKVLVMEWISGHKVNDVRALRRARISAHAVGVKVEAAFAEMTFVHGYLHADPHPGNIMVRAKGRRGLGSYVGSGSWQPFEVVLLDHGCYLKLQEATRRTYCRLWCSLFAGDRAGAAAAAIELGGQRAGQILPIILSQRARTKQERDEMQRAAGVSSFTDMSILLQTAPREVVELLRITAVVRSVTGPLGATRAERLRLNGIYSLRGLALPRSGAAAPPPPPPGEAAVAAVVAGGGPGSTAGSSEEGEGRGASAGAFRLKMQSRLALVNGYVWVNTVLTRVLLATLHVFGQNVPLG